MKALLNITAILTLHAGLFAPYTLMAQADMQNLGNVAFFAPNDWIVQSDLSDDAHQLIVAESPSGALLVTETVKSDSPPSLLEFAKQYSNRVNQSMSFGKIGQSNFQMQTRIGETIGEQGVHEEFELEAFGNQITMVREYFVKFVPGETAFMISQSTKNEWQAHQDAFSHFVSTLSFFEIPISDQAIATNEQPLLEGENTSIVAERVEPSASAAVMSVDSFSEPSGSSTEAFNVAVPGVEVSQSFSATEADTGGDQVLRSPEPSAPAASPEYIVEDQ